MKKIALFLLLLFPSVVMAETPCTTQVYGDFSKEPNWNCPMPNEDSIVPRLEVAEATVPLAKDAKAPFAGLLLDQQRVLQLGLRITGLRRLLWSELKTAKERQDLEVARSIEVVRQDCIATEAQNKLYEARVNQLTGDVQAEKAWYKSWTFGFVLGVTITSVAMISAAVVVK